MSTLSYHSATALDEALALLALPGHLAIGGGTDLLVMIDEGLASPLAVVDVRALATSPVSRMAARAARLVTVRISTSPS